MSVKEKLADILKLLSYQVVYYLVKCIPAKQKPRQLLLVKTDDIGDYMLMRSLLGKFRESEAFRGHRITFVGNIAFRQLFEAVDAQIADEAIWLDKKKFRRDMFYRFSILKRVRCSGFSDAVNLIYSRSFRVDDLLVAVSTSSKNVAMSTADHPGSKVEQMLTPRSIYDRLEDAGEQSLFDAFRNARFVEGLLHLNTDPVSTRWPGVVPRFSLSLPASYFVLVPGAGNRHKRWSTEHFAQAARHFSLNYGLTPVICGSPGDRPDTEPLYSAMDGTAIDLTGRTTLIDLLAVLQGARFLISVDTGAVHLATAVGCPVFGLFSGFHYGRFAPYPRQLTACFFAIYPDEIDEKINNGQLNPNEIPMGLMSRIPFRKVIRLIEKELPLLSQPDKNGDHQTF